MMNVFISEPKPAEHFPEGFSLRVRFLGNILFDTALYAEEAVNAVRDFCGIGFSDGQNFNCTFEDNHVNAVYECKNLDGQIFELPEHNSFLTVEVCGDNSDPYESACLFADIVKTVCSVRSSAGIVFDNRLIDSNVFMQSSREPFLHLIALERTPERISTKGMNLFYKREMYISVGDNPQSAEDRLLSVVRYILYNDIVPQGSDINTELGCFRITPAENNFFGIN